MIYGIIKNYGRYRIKQVLRNVTFEEYVPNPLLLIAGELICEVRRLDGLLQAVLLTLFPECLAADAEDGGGFYSVAARVKQDLLNMFALHVDQ